MKKLLFLLLFISSNILAQGNIFKAGLITVLQCDYNIEYHDYGIAGGFGANCTDSNDNRYALHLAAIGPGYRTFNDYGEFTITVASLNPFGSLDGLYVGSDASIGFGVGISTGLFVGELGTKYLTIGDVITEDETDEGPLVSAFLRVGGFYLDKY